MQGTGDTCGDYRLLAYLLACLLPVGRVIFRKLPTTIWLTADWNRYMFHSGKVQVAFSSAHGDRYNSFSLAKELFH
jgi:hypothetical protein